MESSTGEEVFFKIKRNTKLSKLSGAYATKIGKDLGTFRSVFFLRLISSCRCVDFVLLVTNWSLSYMSTCRFTYDGERITDEDTPDTLDMEENGQIFHSDVRI